MMRNDEAGQDSSVVFSGDSIKTLDPFKGEDPTSKITCELILILLQFHFLHQYGNVC